MNPDTPASGGDGGGESLISLLDQLHDLREPPAVSLWPATPIWWVLGVLLLVGLALALRWWLRRHRANAYRREALAGVDRLEGALARGDAGALAELDRLLRRTALVAFPRREVAALTGADWTAFLDRTGRQDGFAAFGSVLATAPYSARPEQFDGAAFARLARKWIRSHHA